MFGVSLLGEQGRKSFPSAVLAFWEGWMFSKFSAVVVVEYEVDNFSKFFTPGWMVEAPKEQNFHKSQKGNILFPSFFHLSRKS